MLSKEHVQLMELGRNILSALELHKRASFFCTAIRPPKDEDLHVNERSREQISFSYGPVWEKGETNNGREIMHAKS